MIGAVSALCCFTFILVVWAAVGREVHDELERIRRGEKPADDEVRRQWAEITNDLRSRWEQLAERRRRRSAK